MIITARFQYKTKLLVFSIEIKLPSVKASPSGFYTRVLP